MKLVEEYLRDKIGLREATRLAGLSDTGTKSFEQWINIYQNEGPAGLLEKKQNKCYSKETKLQAVHDYLDGNGSLMDITRKYGIRSRQRLQAWIKEYNTHGEIKSRGSGGGSYMRKARQTTPNCKNEENPCLNGKYMNHCLPGKTNHPGKQWLYK